MLEYWRKLAEKNQVGKLAFVYQDITPVHLQSWDRNQFDYMIEYQPRYVRLFKQMNGSKINKFCAEMSGFLSNKIHSLKRKLNLPDFPNVYDYDSVWKKVLDFGPLGKNSFPGAFVNVDTTPRRKGRGTVYQGMTPEKFGKYLKLQIERARDLYKKDMIFLFAWNEWGEGAFIEPDVIYGYSILEKIYNALQETNEDKKSYEAVPASK